MKYWLEKWSYVCVDLPLDLLSTWKATLSSKNVTSRFVKASGKENQALKYTSSCSVFRSIPREGSS